MKRIFTLLVLLAVTAISVQEAEAQTDLKIGYVDPQSIMRAMPEMAAIERRLQNFAERKRQEFAEKEANFRRELDEYEQKASVISDEAKQREETRLAGLNVELQEFQQNFQRELQERQFELLAPLYEKIQDAIDTVASEKGLTYVLNTMTNNGDFIILYASEEAQRNYDITETVMQKLDLM